MWAEVRARRLASEEKAIADLREQAVEGIPSVSEPLPLAQPTVSAAVQNTIVPATVTRRPKPARRYKVELPPLNLLNMPVAAAMDDSELKEKAAVIEQTLGHFGIPAKIIEINHGPMVTQFGVEPGYVTQRGADGEETERKIRVAKIAALNRDLALALAATPIRIEAPVPGRAIVGIEVPNRDVSLVPLRRVMSSPAFRRGKSNLKLALGEGTAGTPVVADLAKMPHLLIAGATGSGKSVCINSIATCLLLQNSPLTLRMVMIDPKRVELARYQGLPHLYGGVESDSERIVAVLRWLVHEMQERYKKLAQVSARHVDDYNRHWRAGSQEYLPRIVVLIDELADMMLFAPEETERSICRLAQMARATGIHVVIATQRPSVDVVTGLIKANFPARIGFAVSSGMDSRVILDAVGAETLLSKGDMLYMAPDASGLVRAQGSLVSDEEMQRVLAYWQAWASSESWEQEPCPWETALGRDSEGDGDELLRRAIEIVREQGLASASMLQRRMRIGYPRASRLIDEMEDRGIVGPAERGGRPRQVLDVDLEPVSDV
jgi:S-DNA-T family DNA segregation ATPase FtsK/SpoIIIE